MAANILLADDDPQIVAVLQKYLERTGYVVQGATDGREALAQFQQGSFQVAILDLMMPGLSGLELLSRFKSISPETEVIIFTGHANLENAIEALRRGAYDYLLKPIVHLDGLKALVDRALERQRLSLANQALIAELRSASEQLAQQRRRELKLIRQIGEGLAGAFNLDRCVKLLFDVIWETIPLTLLSLKLRAGDYLPERFASRAQDGLAPEIQQKFNTWIQQELIAFCQEHLPAPGISAPKAPRGQESLGSGGSERAIPAVLWAPLWVDQKLAGVLGGGRDYPFSLEEQEIFQILVYQTIAALKNLALFEQVKALAIRDGLTGLFNQRYFRQALSDEILRCRRYYLPLSLLFLDLDNFKVINDRYGHHIGDKVLKQLSGLLEHSARHTDLLCRYGGEEFVILLIQTHKKEAVKIAKRLRAQIEQTPIRTDGLEISLTVSIGVAGLTARMNGEKLVQMADSAMYRAKQGGGNRVVSA